MAVISNVNSQAAIDGSAIMVTWEKLDSTDDEGAPVSAIRHADRTVQVTGTFDTGTLTIQGSNDGTNWEILTDVHGTSASFTTAGMASLTEVPLYTKPVLTGAGSDDLDITMLIRMNNTLRT